MTRTSLRHIAQGAVAALFALAAVGCEAPQPLGPVGSVADYITRVATADGSVVATLREGPAPASSGGAAPTVPATGTTVNGGSAQVAVSAGTDFTTVYVTLPGVDDYWELTLPAGASLSDVVVSVGATVTATTLRVQYAVGAAGAVSLNASQTLRIYHVGNGDVQVSVSWTGASDVDLHVYDPSGEEVYFANPVSASGGRLDLDSNAGCSIDNVNNENIVWPVDLAPHGDYRVSVEYWDDCGVARSDYVVTIQAKGVQPRTVSGSFVGAASSNVVAEIGTLTY